MPRRARHDKTSIPKNRNVAFSKKLITTFRNRGPALFLSNADETTSMTKHWTLIALALLLLQSCSWEEDISRLQSPDWNPEIAAPIAKGSITVGQAFDQLENFSYLTVEGDGTLVFRADFPLASWALPDLIDIPDFPVPFVENSLNVPFPVEGLERLDLEAGSLRYQIVSSSQRAIRVEFHFNQLLTDGAETRFSVVLDGAGNFEGTVDLTGMSIQPNGGNMAMSYSAYLDGTDEPMEVDQVALFFSGLEASYLEGQFDARTFVLDPDSLNFQSDLGIDLSLLTLSEPTLDFVVESQSGIPNSFYFTSFQVMDEDGNGHSLEYAPFTEGSSLNLAPAPKTWTESRFTINRDNSNIGELLGLGVPAGLSWEASLIAFPEGPAESGFMTDSDSIRERVEAEAPLAFQLGDTDLSTEIELDLPAIDMLKSGTVSITTENGIPLELDLQVYLLDDHGQTIDSLFTDTQAILAGPEVDGQGYSLEEAAQNIQVNFDEALLEKLDQSTAMRFKATVSTSRNGEVPVRITRDQSIGFRLGVRAQ